MRLLATWELGLGYGHIATIAPIASALARRGHRVVLAARDPVTANTLGRDAFDRVVQAPIYSRPMPVRETVSYAQVIAAGGFVDAESVAGLLRAWLALFELTSPDALLVEHAPVSLLAAHITGLPAVRFGSSFTSPPAVNPLPCLLPWAPRRSEEILAASQAADRIVRDLSRAFAAPPLDGLAELLALAPNHLLTWPELDHYGPQDEVRYHGPLSGIAGTSDGVWPDVPGPRVLVYLPFERAAGTVVAQALGELGWSVLWHAASAPAFRLARNIIWTSAPIDLAVAGERADLFVGRGGHGACAAIVRAGLPQLLLPDTLETLLLTYRLRRAGIALSQSASAGEAAVRIALQHLVGDAQIRTAAMRSSRVHASYDPVAAADEVADDMLTAFRSG